MADDGFDCGAQVYGRGFYEERAQERGDLTIEEFFAQILADQ